MLKKLLVFVTLMSIILTMVIPGVNVFAAFTDGTDSYDAIDGGTIIMERLYTATSDGVVNFQFTSHNESDASVKKYNIIVKLNGLKICGPGGTSEISKLELKEGNTYLVTLVFRHFKDDTDGKSTPAKYYLYINGACVVNGGNDANNGSKLIHDSIVQGANNSNNITTVFVSNDSAADFDMTTYAATISSTDENIILGADEKRNDIAFGGFTTKILKNMKVEKFIQSVTPSTGATVSVVRGTETLANDAYLATGDAVVVTSQNGKVANKYAVTVDAPAIVEPVVNSATYTVEENTITDVYEYTPVSTFMNYLNVEDGWTLTLKNGDDEVTEGKVSEAMTLVASKGEEVQTYAIDILDRKSITTTTSSYVYTFPEQIPASKSAFRGNMVIELKSKVMHGYYTGPNSNCAFYITCNDEGTKLGMFKNIWAGDKPTDLNAGDDLALTFVIKPATDGGNNQVVYYINGDFAGECSMGSIDSKIWEKWRINKETKAEIFMVENLYEYYKSKNINKLNFDGNSLKVNFAGSEAEKVYLAVYSGNKLESVKTMDLSDFYYSQDVINADDNIEGKTVKAFIWTSDLKPVDVLLISEQTDILFDREFEFS